MNTQVRADDLRLIALFGLCAWPMLLHLEHLPRSDPWLMPAYALWVYLGWPVASAGLVFGERRWACTVWLLIGAVGTGIWAGTDLVAQWPRAFLASGVLAALAALSAARHSRVSLVNGLGLGAGEWRSWAGPTAVVCACAVLFVQIGAWMSPELLAFYPVYKPARSDLGALLGFELGMAVHLACWEVFFRGVLLFGSRRAVTDAVAVLLQAVPFFLLHAGKPEVELASSFAGGLALGVLCLWARSCWPAVFAHVAMYAAMDITGALAR